MPPNSNNHWGPFSKKKKQLKQPQSGQRSKADVSQQGAQVTVAADEPITTPSLQHPNSSQYGHGPPVSSGYDLPSPAPAEGNTRSPARIRSPDRPAAHRPKTKTSRSREGTATGAGRERRVWSHPAQQDVKWWQVWDERAESAQPKRPGNVSPIEDPFRNFSTQDTEPTMPGDQAPNTLAKAKNDGTYRRARVGHMSAPCPNQETMSKRVSKRDEVCEESQDVTAIHSTVVHSIQICLNSKKGPKTKRYNLDMQAVKDIATLLSESPPKAFRARDCLKSGPMSCGGATFGAAENGDHGETREKGRCQNFNILGKEDFFLQPPKLHCLEQFANASCGRNFHNLMKRQFNEGLSGLPTMCSSSSSGHRSNDSCDCEKPCHSEDGVTAEQDAKYNFVSSSKPYVVDNCSPSEGSRNFTEHPHAMFQKGVIKNCCPEEYPQIGLAGSASLQDYHNVPFQPEVFPQMKSTGGKKKKKNCKSPETSRQPCDFTFNAHGIHLRARWPHNAAVCLASGGGACAQGPAGCRGDSVCDNCGLLKQDENPTDAGGCGLRHTKQGSKTNLPGGPCARCGHSDRLNQQRPCQHSYQDSKKESKNFEQHVCPHTFYDPGSFDFRKCEGQSDFSHRDSSQADCQNLMKSCQVTCQTRCHQICQIPSPPALGGSCQNTISPAEKHGRDCSPDLKSRQFNGVSPCKPEQGFVECRPSDSDEPCKSGGSHDPRDPCDQQKYDGIINKSARPSTREKRGSHWCDEMRKEEHERPAPCLETDQDVDKPESGGPENEIECAKDTTEREKAHEGEEMGKGLKSKELESSFHSNKENDNLKCSPSNPFKALKSCSPTMREKRDADPYSCKKNPSFRSECISPACRRRWQSSPQGLGEPSPSQSRTPDGNGPCEYQTKRPRSQASQEIDTSMPCTPGPCKPCDFFYCDESSSSNESSQCERRQGFDEPGEKIQSSSATEGTICQSESLASPVVRPIPKKRFKSLRKEEITMGLDRSSSKILTRVDSGNSAFMECKAQDKVVRANNNFRNEAVNCKSKLNEFDFPLSIHCCDKLDGTKVTKKEILATENCEFLNKHECLEKLGNSKVVLPLSPNRTTQTRTKCKHNQEEFEKSISLLNQLGSDPNVSETAGQFDISGDRALLSSDIADNKTGSDNDNSLLYSFAEEVGYGGDRLFSFIPLETPSQRPFSYITNCQSAEHLGHRSKHQKVDVNVSKPHSRNCVRVSNGTNIAQHSPWLKSELRNKMQLSQSNESELWIDSSSPQQKPQNSIGKVSNPRTRKKVYSANVKNPFKCSFSESHKRIRSAGLSSKHSKLKAYKTLHSQQVRKANSVCEGFEPKFSRESTFVVRTVSQNAGLGQADESVISALSRWPQMSDAGVSQGKEHGVKDMLWSVPVLPGASQKQERGKFYPAEKPSVAMKAPSNLSLGELKNMACVSKLKSVFSGALGKQKKELSDLKKSKNAIENMDAGSILPGNNVDLSSASNGGHEIVGDSLSHITMKSGENLKKDSCICMIAEDETDNCKEFRIAQHDEGVVNDDFICSNSKSCKAVINPSPLSGPPLGDSSFQTSNARPDWASLVGVMTLSMMTNIRFPFVGHGNQARGENNADLICLESEEAGTSRHENKASLLEKNTRQRDLRSSKEIATNNYPFRPCRALPESNHQGKYPDTSLKEDNEALQSSMKCTSERGGTSCRERVNSKTERNVNIFLPCRDPLLSQRCLGEAHEPCMHTEDRNPNDSVLQKLQFDENGVQPNHTNILTSKRDPSFEDICHAAQDLLKSSGPGQNKQWDGKCQEYLERQPRLSFSIESIQRITVEQHISNTDLSKQTADKTHKNFSVPRPEDSDCCKFKYRYDNSQSYQDKSPKGAPNDYSPYKSLAAPKSDIKASKSNKSGSLFPSLNHPSDEPNGSPRLRKKTFLKCKSPLLSPSYNVENKAVSQNISKGNKSNTVIPKQNFPIKKHSDSLKTPGNLKAADVERRNTFHCSRTPSRCACSPSEKDFKEKLKTTSPSSNQHAKSIFYHQTSPSSSSSGICGRAQKDMKTCTNATNYIGNRTKEGASKANSSRCSSPRLLSKSQSSDINEVISPEPKGTVPPSRRSRETSPKQSTSDRSPRSVRHVSDSRHSKHKDKSSASSSSKNRRTSERENSQKIQKNTGDEGATSPRSCRSAFSISLSPGNTDLDCSWSRSRGQPASPCLVCGSPGVDRHASHESICERYWRELDESSPMGSLSLSPVPSSILEADEDNLTCLGSIQSCSAESVNSGRDYRSLNQSKSSNKCPVTCCCSQCIDLYVKKRSKKDRGKNGLRALTEDPQRSEKGTVKRGERGVPLDNVKEVWLKLYSTYPEMTGTRHGSSVKRVRNVGECHHGKRQTCTGVQRPSACSKKVNHGAAERFRNVRPKRVGKARDETQAEPQHIKELGKCRVCCDGLAVGETRACEHLYDHCMRKDYQRFHQKKCKVQGSANMYKQNDRNCKCKHCNLVSPEPDYLMQNERRPISKCCCKGRVNNGKCFQKKREHSEQCLCESSKFSHPQSHHCSRSSDSCRDGRSCVKQDVTRRRKRKHQDAYSETQSSEDKSSPSQMASSSSSDLVCTKCSQKSPHLSRDRYHQDKTVSEEERLKKIMHLCSGILSEYINTYNKFFQRTKIDKDNQPTRERRGKITADKVSKDNRRGRKRKRHSKSVQTSKYRSTSSGSSSLCSSETRRIVSKVPKLVMSSETWPNTKHKENITRTCKRTKACFSSSTASGSSDLSRGSSKAKKKKRVRLKKQNEKSGRKCKKGSDGSESQPSSSSQASSSDRRCTSLESTSEESSSSRGMIKVKAKHKKRKYKAKEMLKHNRVANGRRMANALSSQTHRLLKLEQNIDHNIMETICKPPGHKLNRLRSLTRPDMTSRCNRVHSDHCLTRKCKRKYRQFCKEYSPMITRSLFRHNNICVGSPSKNYRDSRPKSEKTMMQHFRASHYSKYDSYNRYTQRESPSYQPSPVAAGEFNLRMLSPPYHGCSRRRSPLCSPRSQLITSKPSSYTSLLNPRLRTLSKARTSATYTNAHMESNDERSLNVLTTRHPSPSTSPKRYQNLVSCCTSPHKSREALPSLMSPRYFKCGETRAQPSQRLLRSTSSRQREFDIRERRYAGICTGIATPSILAHGNEERLKPEEQSTVKQHETLSPGGTIVLEHETVKGAPHTTGDQQIHSTPNLSEGEAPERQSDVVLGSRRRTFPSETLSVFEFLSENSLHNSHNEEEDVEEDISSAHTMERQQSVEFQKDASSNRCEPFTERSPAQQETESLVTNNADSKKEKFLPQAKLVETDCQVIDLSGDEA